MSNEGISPLDVMENHSRNLELLVLSVRTLKDCMRDVYGQLKGVCGHGCAAQGVCDRTLMMEGVIEGFSMSILASMKCSMSILNCSTSLGVLEMGFWS